MLFLGNLVRPVRIHNTKHCLLKSVSNILSGLANNHGTARQSLGVLFVNISLNFTA